MATTVTISMSQLQGLLDAQTSQFRSILQNQMTVLETNLEQMVEEKLQAKFEEAEESVKQFVKDSVDDDDDEDVPNQELQAIKDHVMAMEQSVSRFVMGSSMANTGGGATNQEIEVELDTLAIGPSVTFPPPPSSLRRNISAASSINTSMMEKMVTDMCGRLEELVDDRTNTMLKKVEKVATASNSGAATPTNNSVSKPKMIRRSNSSDSAQSQPSSQMSAAHATAMAMRLNHHQLDELLTKRMGNLEQFIDSRHAELEAYYSSASDQLKKSILEALSKHARSIRPGLTKDELEAVLDARIQDVEEEDAAVIMAFQQQQEEQKQLEESKNNQSFNQQQQEPAESSFQQQQQQSNNIVHMALEKLIQVQQEWIDVQTSTHDLEQQVQEKLEILQDNQLKQPSLEMQKVATKLESLEQLVLATLTPTAMATNQAIASKNAKKKQQRSSTKSSSTSGRNKSASNSARSVNNKGLSQVLSSSSDNKPKKTVDDTSTNVATTASTAVADNTGAPRISSAYMDVSVDGRRMEEPEDDNNKDDVISDSDLDNENENDNENNQNKAASAAASGDNGGANRVTTFMNTLNNWNELKQKKDEALDQRESIKDDIDIDIDIDEDDDDLEEDDDDGDDDIDSNASMTADGTSLGGGAEDKDVTKTMQRLESKLDGLEDKVHRLLVATGNHHVIDHGTPVGIQRERSTNAKHSRPRQYSSAEDVERMVFAAHDALKRDLQRWLAAERNDDDLAILSTQSNSGGTATDVSDEDPTSSPSGRQHRATNGSNGNKHRGLTAVLGPEQLQLLTERLKGIELLATTNQSFLQEQRRLAAPPVPTELPLQKDVAPTLELERRILSHLNTMDKSVQFKLDEIYAELQQPSRRRSTISAVVSPGDGGDDLASLSREDQSAIVEVIQARLQEIQDAITRQLKESIPDYGNAKSIIGETLEEMRQIVSEVAISEVELLKTQLGVAEEAEQEALHAVVVLREKLEESKEQERRLLYANAPRPPPQSAQPPSNIFNFGAFAKLGLSGIASATAAPTVPSQQRPSTPERYRHRKTSMGSSNNSHPHHGSAASLWSHHTPNNTFVTSSKRRTPQQKYEDWKSQVATMEDKATDLRTLYSQLREQDEDEWLSTSEQRSNTDGSAPIKRIIAGESKETELTNNGAMSM